MLRVLQLEHLSRLRDDDILKPVILSEEVGIELLGLVLAMYHEHLLDSLRVLALQVIRHLLIVAMSAEGVNRIDISINSVRDTEDRDIFITISDTCSECCRSAVTHYKDRVLLIINIICEMMFYSSRLHHA